MTASTTTTTPTTRPDPVSSVVVAIFLFFCFRFLPSPICAGGMRRRKAPNATSDPEEMQIRFRRGRACIPALSCSFVALPAVFSPWGSTDALPSLVQVVLVLVTAQVARLVLATLQTAEGKFRAERLGCPSHNSARPVRRPKRVWRDGPRHPRGVQRRCCTGEERYDRSASSSCILPCKFRADSVFAKSLLVRTVLYTSCFEGTAFDCWMGEVACVYDMVCMHRCTMSGRYAELRRNPPRAAHTLLSDLLLPDISPAVRAGSL